MPPKRKPRHLDAIRIEVNDTERDLIQQAIIANGVSGVARGLGTAVAGLGGALGLVAAVIVWKEGMDWFRDMMEQGKKEWLLENCSQEKYDAYATAHSRIETRSEPMLYHEWCNRERDMETIKRRSLVGTFFPLLNMVGASEYGFKDWFSGKG